MAEYTPTEADWTEAMHLVRAAANGNPAGELFAAFQVVVFISLLNKMV
jgi:hypothetical protein